MPQPVLAAGARTSIGKLLGSPAAPPAPALGALRSAPCCAWPGLPGTRSTRSSWATWCKRALTRIRPGWPPPAAASRWACPRPPSASSACPGWPRSRRRRSRSSWVLAGRWSPGHGVHVGRACLSRNARRGLRYGAGVPLEDALGSDALILRVPAARWARRRAATSVTRSRWPGQQSEECVLVW